MTSTRKITVELHADTLEKWRSAIQAFDEARPLARETYSDADVLTRCAFRGAGEYEDESR